MCLPDKGGTPSKLKENREGSLHGFGIFVRLNDHRPMGCNESAFFTFVDSLRAARCHFGSRRGHTSPPHLRRDHRYADKVCAMSQ
jgi:hypothetical protein